MFSQFSLRGFVLVVFACGLALQGARSNAHQRGSCAWNLRALLFRSTPIPYAIANLFSGREHLLASPSVRADLRESLREVEELLTRVSEGTYDRPFDPARQFQGGFRGLPQKSQADMEANHRFSIGISDIIRRASEKLKRPQWVPEEESDLLDDAWLRTHCASLLVHRLIVATVVPGTVGVVVVGANEYIYHQKAGTASILGTRPMFTSIGEAVTQAEANQPGAMMAYLVSASVLLGPSIAGFVLLTGPPCRAIKDKWGPLVQEVRQAEARHLAEHLKRMRENVWGLGDDMPLVAQPPRTEPLPADDLTH